MRLPSAFANRRKSLIEIRRDIGKTCAFRRLGRQTESGARLINIFQRLLHLCIRHAELLAFLIELFLACYFGLEKLLRAIELRLGSICVALLCSHVATRARMRAT